MPWKGVTVSEQKQRFIEDFLLNYYSVAELSERFSISRKTAYKWINRYLEQGQGGLAERSRRPKCCPWQTPSEIVEELVGLRTARPRRGPKKLLGAMMRRDPDRQLPAISTAAKILAEAGLVKPRRRYRRAHPGCPQTKAAEANDICLHLWRRHKWPADYKGQFRLKNGTYCFPLTVSDLATRFILGVDAHPTISLEQTRAHFRRLFAEHGLPKRIRTDKGFPSPRMPCLRQPMGWRGYRSCQSGLSNWGSTRSCGTSRSPWRGSSPASRSRTGCTSGCIGR